MESILNYIRTKSVRTIIIATCIVIVVALVVSLFLATFTSFESGVNEAINTQTRELSTQIVYNYENYINSIIETSNIVQTDIDLYDFDGGGAAFSEYLEEIVHLKSDILEISVFDLESEACIGSSSEAEIGLSFYDDGLNWYDEAILDPTIHVFSSPYSDTEGGEYLVNVSKQIKYQRGAKAGLLKIEISFQRFIELLEKSNLGQGGHITIIDPGYSVVYTSLEQPRLSEGEIGVIREIILGYTTAALDGYNMSINVETLSNTKWRICVFINIDNIEKIKQDFMTTATGISLFILAIGIVLFAAVARTITTPIKQLESAMRKVEKADYFRIEAVDITASKEVEALIRRFNKMMSKINELMNRVIDEQNARRKSELKALQNQITPHFLYNTLDSIIWLIENGRSREAGEMVVALAKLFRIGISNDSDVIPVADELEHVRNYLLIQSIRYSDSFTYEFSVDEEALAANTVKLILQPIVENCIYHGLRNSVDKGLIKISASVQEGFLVLSVSDNGFGMRQEQIDSLYDSFRDGVASNSVGLKNIYQRVMIYYGGSAEMLIESELDIGTTITIKVIYKP
jgi:two-component system sensor histidine kinase YesM